MWKHWLTLLIVTTGFKYSKEVVHTGALTPERQIPGHPVVLFVAAFSYSNTTEDEKICAKHG